jgi:hypothetical protein
VTSPAVRLSYAIAVAFAACACIAFASVLYSDHVRKESDRRAEESLQESNRRWCSLLGELDAAYQMPPGPSSDLGRRIANEIRRLLGEFGCRVPEKGR